MMADEPTDVDVLAELFAQLGMEVPRREIEGWDEDRRWRAWCWGGPKLFGTGLVPPTPDFLAGYVGGGR